MMSQNFKNVREMGYVKIKVSTLHQNIIKKHNHYFAQQRAKNVIHSGLERCQSVAKAKKHQKVPIMSIMGLKNYFGVEGKFDESHR